jgi:glycerol uptake facilitator protein
LAVSIAIFTTASVSGCHANPAVTLALACFRKFSWAKVLPYCFAQIAGAFAGAACVYVLFSPVIDLFNITHHLTRQAGGAASVFFHPHRPRHYTAPRLCRRDHPHSDPGLRDLCHH